MARPAAGRRGGPDGEEPWWSPADQRAVEGLVVHRRLLGRGWRPAAMINNDERLDPLGDDPASDVVREARLARRLTALDEGRAWRHIRSGGLVVLRVEAFAEADDAEHRQAWQAQGASSLGATWRERWRERDQTPGWVEATVRGPGQRPAMADLIEGSVDWFRVEDHTDPTGSGRVKCYEHLTVWAGRGHLVVTARHDLGADPAELAAAAVATVAHDLGRALH